MIHDKQDTVGIQREEYEDLLNYLEKRYQLYINSRKVSQNHQ